MTLFVAYRAYVSEREKHERLELLYESSRILQDSPQLDSALLALLEHAREMFRAEMAEIVLYPHGDGEAPANEIGARRDVGDDGAPDPDRQRPGPAADVDRRWGVPPRSGLRLARPDAAPSARP